MTTDYEADHDGDQGFKQVEWIEIWRYEAGYPLTRFALLWAIIALAAWILTQLLLA